MVVVLFLIQAVIFGCFCAYVARQKGLVSGNWFFLGFLFSILALIALIAIPNGTLPQNSRSINDSMRKCQFCAEMVKAEAKICRFCQHELPLLPTQENTVSVSSAPQSKIFSSGNWICVKCNKSNGCNDKTCWNCSTPLKL